MKGVERENLPDRIIAVHLDHVIITGGKRSTEKPQDEQALSPHRTI